jgi:hypothetical protein
VDGKRLINPKIKLKKKVKLKIKQKGSSPKNHWRKNCCQDLNIYN